MISSIHNKNSKNRVIGESYDDQKDMTINADLVKIGRVKKLKNRLSISFSRLALSRSSDALDRDASVSAGVTSLDSLGNGRSDEFLDRLEPNGNVPKPLSYLTGCQKDCAARDCGVTSGRCPVCAAACCTNNSCANSGSCCSSCSCSCCCHSRCLGTDSAGQCGGDPSPADCPPRVGHCQCDAASGATSGATTVHHSASSAGRLADDCGDCDGGSGGEGSGGGGGGDLTQQQQQQYQRRPPRPRSEACLLGGDYGRDQVSGRGHPRSAAAAGCHTKRASAFGGDSPFGRKEAYIKLEQLGEGSYATVYKGYSYLTGQVVALKEIRLQSEEGTPFTAIREASLLKQLRHFNIVTLHDIVHTATTLTLVFEHLHTDLWQYMQRHPGGLQPGNVRLLLLQLLRGLAYCHARRILHRDLKPHNLLLSERGELKLADFGLARAKSVPSHTYSHEVVTLWYRPPDVLLGSKEYSTSLDMWGVGCIFVEMACGSPCFPGVHKPLDQLLKIVAVLGLPQPASWPGVQQLPGYRQLVAAARRRGGGGGGEWPAGERLGSAFPVLRGMNWAEALAYKLLALVPERRISAASALQHRYFGDWSHRLRQLADTDSVLSVADPGHSQHQLLVPERRPAASSRASSSLARLVAAQQYRQPL